jgi:hypothetical protein
VRFVFVYEPGETAVFARDIVPIEVIGPPVSPVPVAISVTVPALAKTNAVVANWVVLVPRDAVGAFGTPENAGDTRGAKPATRPFA